MPVRQPFTALCQALCRRPADGRADLHIHTIHSDGTYTPAEVVDLAGRSGLTAIAITDHDTVGGIEEARTRATGHLEVVSGVEISTVYRDHELHLLAYFVDLENRPLRSALEELAAHRTSRFWDMVERLRGCGVQLEDTDVRRQIGQGALGRRHLAEMLVKARQVSTIREAFTRYLRDGGRVDVPKVRLPVADALQLVRGAGGVASWAHPSYDCTRETLQELRAWGLTAVEVDYPSARVSRRRELRGWASELDLAVTGGSDCHGPDAPRQALGSCSISSAELEILRRRAAAALPTNVLDCWRAEGRKPPD